MKERTSRRHRLVLPVAFAACAACAAPAPPATPSFLPPAPAPATQTGHPAVSLPPAGTPVPVPTATPTATPSPTLRPTPTPSPSGPVRYDRSGDGYALSLPASWLVLDLSAGDLDALVTQLGQTQPQLAGFLRAYLGLTGGRGFSLLGLDLAPERLTGGLPPNVNVVVQPSLGLSLDFFAQITVGALQRLPGISGPVQQERVALPAGEAFKASYGVSAGPPGAEVRTAVVHYLIVSGGRAYVVTFTTREEDLARDSPVFDAIVRSLELVT